MPIAPALRRRLKNPATARVYQGSLNILRRAAIWHDLLLARCARRAVPAVSVRRRPSAAVDTDRIAVFVIHAETLDASHRRALRALAAAGYCVALVNNQAFDLEDVPPEAAFVIENHNVGRDIGAYIRTLRCLQAEGVLPSLGRVLFLNDS
ncbi:MAG TPA: hypothetical protein VE690_16790, partial [Rhodopila sp.]|nr:hypothetical protein [Rhodopila sp.]